MKIKNETKVGILATVAIAILVLGYSFLKGNDVFTSENTYYATYDRVDGLSVSKPIFVNGYQIGRVSGLTLQPSGLILTEFKIDKKYRLPENTLARIASTDLLGSKAIVFELGNSAVFAQDGDTLQADIQKNIMEQVEPVQKKAESGNDKTERHQSKPCAHPGKKRAFGSEENAWVRHFLRITLSPSQVFRCGIYSALFNQIRSSQE